MKNLFVLLAILSIGKFVFAQEKISDQEADAIGQLLEQSFKLEHPTALDSLLNAKEFAKNPAFKAQDSKSVQSMVKGMNLTNVIKTSVGADGHYMYVKHIEKEGKTMLRFRLFTSESGINYHEFVLNKNKGKIVITDCYILLTDEYLSETLGNMLDAIDEGYDNAKNEKAFTKDMLALKEIKKLIDKNDNEKAYELLNSLPKEIQNYRISKIYRITIASNLDEAIYLKELEAYKTSGLSKGHINLMLIDKYLLMNDYDKSLEAVNGLDDAMDDPFLDYHRFIISSVKKEYTKAGQLIEKLSVTFPKVEIIQLNLIQYYMGMEEKGKLDKAINAFKANKSFNQAKLTELLKEE